MPYMQPHRRMDVTEWAYLVALAVIWSHVFLLTRIALGDMQPFTVVALRLGLGAIMLHGAVFCSGSRMPLTLRTWMAFIAMGALNNLLPFCLIAWGQTQIASGLAAILNATTPLFTVLLAHVATRDERMTANRLSGVLLGLAGVAVMIGPSAMRGLTKNVLGQFAILAAAACYACAGIFGRRLRYLPPMVAAAGQVTTSALMALPLALFVDRPWLLAMPGIAAWLASGAAAMFCTALGYALYFRVLATAGATNLLLVTLLMPIGAVLLGFVALGEHVEPREIGGMVVIGLGLVVMDGRLLASLNIRSAY
jgi:drug/metabolite transporter (DMT)-like permease